MIYQFFLHGFAAVGLVILILMTLGVLFGPPPEGEDDSQAS